MRLDCRSMLLVRYFQFAGNRWLRTVQVRRNIAGTHSLRGTCKKSPDPAPPPPCQGITTIISSRTSACDIRSGASMRPFPAAHLCSPASLLIIGTSKMLQAAGRTYARGRGRSPKIIFDLSKSLEARMGAEIRASYLFLSS